MEEWFEVMESLPASKVRESTWQSFAFRLFSVVVVVVSLFHVFVSPSSSMPTQTQSASVDIGEYNSSLFANDEYASPCVWSVWYVRPLL